MELKGKAYDRRIQGYSKSTLQLIMDINHISKEAATEKLKITSNSELTEEQVVEQLKKLKEEYLKTSNKMK